MPVIDCHQHFWRLAQRPASFRPAAGSTLDRDFTEDHLRPMLATCRIDRTVLVQAINDLAETEENLAIARHVDFVGGVVGWVPLAEPARCAAELERLRAGGKLVGIRHLITQEPQDWLQQEPVRQSLGQLAAAGLVFEGTPVNDAQIEALLAVARQWPDLKIVLNHMANPPVPEQGWEPWATQIARAAELRNVSIKLSVGRALLMRWRWSVDELRRYADHIIDLFSPDRVMAASNWPVILLGAGFAEAWHGVESLVAGLSEPERQAVLGGTAQRIYGL